jgi:uncharacterized membrane protein YcaP (DUF421 family)
MKEFFDTILGADNETIEWWQMCIRAFLIFFLALIMIRIAGMRTFGKKSTFDVLVGILLGSILARTITGNSPFLGTILAGLVIVLLHRIIGIITFYNDFAGKILKGESEILYKNGRFYWQNMKRNEISEKDIEGSLRENANLTRLEDVEEVYFERSGNISIIPKQKKD